jgi:hypothetical protein
VALVHLAQPRRQLSRSPPRLTNTTTTATLTKESRKKLRTPGPNGLETETTAGVVAAIYVSPGAGAAVIEHQRDGGGLLNHVKMPAKTESLPHSMMPAWLRLSWPVRPC